ncbi:MAG TPA: ATP-binding protein [Candidatus Saccharimonadales bacterium]|nr:ATP-binding protein [Candidatus Saccharimonadales bacterium]
MKSPQAAGRSLAVRITVVAAGIGLAILIGVITIVGALSSAPTNVKAAIVIAVLICLPVLIGWLVAQLVIRPLRRFTAAIALLRANRYKTQLQSVGITEFDQVFDEFNKLTARLQSEEELRKDLISDVSHELYTPLTGLSGQLAAVQDGTLPLDTERTELMKIQIDRLIELVKGMDAYTQARLPATKLQEVQLAPLCQRVVKGLASECNKKGIQVTVEVPDDLVVHADRQAVWQILHNLLQNSLHYAQASEVRIVADTAGLTFSDNGRGVPPESLPHLFERFYRVEKSRNRSTGGLGLGLAIVKELAERQGWSIRTRNTKPGLSFTLTFHP